MKSRWVLWHLPASKHIEQKFPTFYWACQVNINWSLHPENAVLCTSGVLSVPKIAVFHIYRLVYSMQHCRFTAFLKHWNHQRRKSRWRCWTQCISLNSVRNASSIPCLKKKLLHSQWDTGHCHQQTSWPNNMQVCDNCQTTIPNHNTTSPGLYIFKNLWECMPNCHSDT